MLVNKSKLTQLSELIFRDASYNLKELRFLGFNYMIDLVLPEPGHIDKIGHADGEALYLSSKPSLAGLFLFVLLRLNEVIVLFFQLFLVLWICVLALFEFLGITPDFQEIFHAAYFLSSVSLDPLQGVEKVRTLF